MNRAGPNAFEGTEQNNDKTRVALESESVESEGTFPWGLSGSRGIHRQPRMAIEWPAPHLREFTQKNRHSRRAACRPTDLRDAYGFILRGDTYCERTLLRQRCVRQFVAFACKNAAFCRCQTSQSDESAVPFSAKWKSRDAVGNFLLSLQARCT